MSRPTYCVTVRKDGITEEVCVRAGSWPEAVKIAVQLLGGGTVVEVEPLTKCGDIVTLKGGGQ